jgi:hypothetical protein
MVGVVLDHEILDRPSFRLAFWTRLTVHMFSFVSGKIAAT